METKRQLVLYHIPLSRTVSLLSAALLRRLDRLQTNRYACLCLLSASKACMANPAGTYPIPEPSSLAFYILPKGPTPICHHTEVKISIDELLGKRIFSPFDRRK